MRKNNRLIRDALYRCDRSLYYLGSVLGVSESTVTRMMRDELPEEEQKRIVQLIETHVRKE